ncbi:MAG: 1,4-alpha-glucan branching protein GlgB [Pseudomonadota bacterium]
MEKGRDSRTSEGFSLLTNDDIHLFNEGRHFRLYEKLGSHPVSVNGINGTYFAVWAPDATHVSVIGNFNRWDRYATLLHHRGSSGIWEGFIPGITTGACYKYFIKSKFHGYEAEKADPFARMFETPPKSASIVWQGEHRWSDRSWMQTRGTQNSHKAPISIYEVHLGSWMRVPEEGNRSLTYRELGPKLADYCKWMGFTHVQLLPIMEHPYYLSWGYQSLGYFAPTSRYGNPEDFAYFVDCLHQAGVGVILDWVPSHFPCDGHGLGDFDGTHLFEHADSRKGFHPDWKSYIFNYGRNEVRSFLISSALFWLDRFHADGIRVDAVASMLYLDYSRKAGEWIPNQYGGKENIEAIEFLRTLNAEIYRNYPDVQTIAEESTSWGMVSRPTHVGGLGFGMKWDMGWMHDTLKYMSKDSIYRKFHHNLLSFRMLYAYHENFVLPLSHDEVTHGKGSLIGKMPGDQWQQFANMRALFGYMYAQSGKKLLFMGGEFGQFREWVVEESLEWHVLQYRHHAGLRQWVRDLNHLYRTEKAMSVLDFEPRGFEWIDCNDAEQSTISLIRRDEIGEEILLFVTNFTTVPRYSYILGVPEAGHWEELLNSDSEVYGGSNIGNLGGTWSEPRWWHGRPHSVTVNLPPLATVVLKWRRNQPARD